MTDKDIIIASQEAEILRLHGAIDELKNTVEKHIELPVDNQSDHGWRSAMRMIQCELNRITGASND